MRKLLTVLALWLALFSTGCMYHVPGTARLSSEKYAIGVACERCARSHDWKGLWDLRVHSGKT